MGIIYVTNLLMVSICFLLKTYMCIFALLNNATANIPLCVCMCVCVCACVRRTVQGFHKVIVLEIA